jgi:hypothetical protein
MAVFVAGAVLVIFSGTERPAVAMPLGYEDAFPEESSLIPVLDAPGSRDALVTEGANDALHAIIDGAQPESSLRRPRALGNTAVKGDAAPWHIGSTEDIIRSLAMIDATAATNIELLREIRRLWSGVASTRGRPDTGQPQQDSLEDPFRDMIRDAVTEIVTSSRTEALLEIAVDTQRVVNALTTSIGQAVGPNTPAPADPDTRQQHPVEVGQPVDAKANPAAPVFALLRTIVTDPYTILLGVLIALAWIARSIIGWAQSRRVRPKSIRARRGRRHRGAKPTVTGGHATQAIPQPAIPVAIALDAPRPSAPRGATGTASSGSRPSRPRRWRRRRSRAPI